MKNKPGWGILIFVFTIAWASCTKTAVQFGSDGTEGDPNIVMVDTFTATLSTLQVDSFLTNSSSHFIVGSNTDPQLGYIAAKSYFQVTAPSLDLSDCNTCGFDSVDIRLKLSSGYMGDTTLPYTVNVYEVAQDMDETTMSIGYNVSNVACNATPLASKTFYIRPSTKDEIRIRLPDSWGRNFFRMFKTNSDTVREDARFKTFVKGFCLQTSGTNNALFYFDKTSGDSIIQFHYTENVATPLSKSAFFTISSTDHQFNSFAYDKSGTALSVFTPGKKELISNSLTNNTIFLHNNSGLYPKIQFNNLYHIKELHPYVEILNAVLEIKPLKESYSPFSLYPLPPSVELRLTDDDNGINGNPLYTLYGGTTYTQTGSLYIDNLYGENTAYNYDVTSFVKTAISEGAFSKTALIMAPSASDESDRRLLIGSPHSGVAVTLKLYILGL